VLYAAQGSPLELLSNRYLFSAHMLQMLLLVLVAAPLLLAGTPAWVWRALLSNLRPLRDAVRFCTRPARALAPFVLVFYAYLLPALTESALASGWLYLLEHAATFLAALLLWWPVLGPLPEPARLRPLGQVLYLGAGMLAMLPACALLALAGGSLYPTYGQAPRLWGWLTPPLDQQLAALAMFLANLATFGTAALVAFLRLAGEDAVAFTPGVQAEAADHRTPRAV
jgi:putative membrane protein